MSLKLYKIFMVLLLVVSSCRYNEPLVIEPISKEFNEDYLNGKGLDMRLFSKKDVMQYYQVAGYDNQPDTILLEKLSSYVKGKYQIAEADSLESLTVLFYQKKPFVNYADHLYESARDNESGALEGYADHLLARIVYSRIKQERKVERRQVLYTKKGKPIVYTDTVSSR